MAKLLNENTENIICRQTDIYFVYIVIYLGLSDTKINNNLHTSCQKKKIDITAQLGTRISDFGFRISEFGIGFGIWLTRSAWASLGMTKIAIAAAAANSA